MGSNPTHSANYGNRLSEKSGSFFVFGAMMVQLGAFQLFREKYRIKITLESKMALTLNVLSIEALLNCCNFIVVKWVPKQDFGS